MIDVTLFGLTLPLTAWLFSCMGIVVCLGIAIVLLILIGIIGLYVLAFLTALVGAIVSGGKKA